jgi:hemoglobin/transferrin/lactoferrin receptor protein
MRKIGKLAVILSAATALYAHSALAQTVVAETEDKGSIFLDQMTFTKTRNPLPAFDAPGMVTVLERDDIERAQPSSPDDVLRFVPGVEFNGGPRRTGETPSIRGFDGAYVVVLFDGVRQDFGSAHDGRFFIDPELLRRIEVLRGSASSLYGSGGTGGILEFRTARAEDFLEPGEKAGARISAGYQDVNTEEFESLTAYAQSDSGGDGSKLINSDDEVIADMLEAGADIAEDHYFEAEEPNNGQGVGGGGERSSYDTQSIFAFYAPTEGPLSGFRVDIGVDNVFDEAYSRTFTNANEPGRNSKARVSYKLAF